MRPNEQSTVEVFSPCWERKLSKSVVDKMRVSKKEENLNRCPPSRLEGRRESIIPRRYFNVRYIRWIAVVTGNFYRKTIKINDTLCAVFHRTRLI